MARTALTRTKAPGPNPTAGTPVTMNAADVTNKNITPLTGRELIIAHNTSTTAARTVTINSVEDPFKRTRDITSDSIAIGAIHVYGPFSLEGWRQTTGDLHLEASNAEVKFGVLVLP